MIFGYLDRNRDVSNEIEIFRKFWPNSKFSPILTNFSEILSKIYIFHNFDQNRGLSKIFTKIEIFKDFEQNRYFSKILTKIRIFPKFAFFRKFWQKSGFFESLT